MAKNPKFTILLYHKIGKYPQSAKFPGLYVTEDDFDRQIKYLKNTGYAFLTLSELKTLYDYYYKAKEAGSPDSPQLINLTPVLEKKKYAAITFDDGSKSVYSGGLKVMRNNGVKATVFMVSGLIGGVNEWDMKNGENIDEMLSLSELKEMFGYGIEIGAHTMTHPRLTQISPEEAFNEISLSKKNLEDLLGASVNFFAYPYGDYSEETKSWLKKRVFTAHVLPKPA
jgi:Predicted xylanase/chitin deacetylase